MQILLAELTLLPEYQLLIFYLLTKDDLQLSMQVRKEVSLVVLFYRSLIRYSYIQAFSCMVFCPL